MVNAEEKATVTVQDAQGSLALQVRTAAAPQHAVWVMCWVVYNHLNEEFTISDG